MNFMNLWIFVFCDFFEFYESLDFRVLRIFESLELLFLNLLGFRFSAFQQQTENT